MSNPHNLTVGQKLWFVPEQHYNGPPRAVAVDKIGRVWATLSDGRRMSLDRLQIDGNGYDSPGRCHLSRDEWEAQKKRDLAWSNVRRAVQQQVGTPKDFDPINLDKISRLLGIYIDGATFPPRTDPDLFRG